MVWPKSVTAAATPSSSSSARLAPRTRVSAADTAAVRVRAVRVGAKACSPRVLVSRRRAGPPHRQHHRIHRLGQRKRVSVTQWSIRCPRAMLSITTAPAAAAPTASRAHPPVARRRGRRASAEFLMEGGPAAAAQAVAEAQPADAAAPIDGSEEARAIAAAAREAAKRKHEEVAAAGAAAEQPQAPKKQKHAQLKKRVSTSTHTVAVPADCQPLPQLDAAVYGTLEHPAYTGPPAKVYPFELDTFQRTSVACLERRESVLVAAHTSAGKTVVAEYAIAMAFRDKQRVIYTSPLKALSNQKFRELSEEFVDVGLMTGDVTINPNANCVVMTTEILRSMIYRGSELMREVAWVIFDEVHYMQDRERGVVWEEIIIFLPHDVKMVFLSATLANAREFSEWVAHLHRQPCHVVYTEFRPTPLEHYLCPVGGSGLYKIMSEKGFNEEVFKKMQEAVKAAKEEAANGAEADDDDGKAGADSGGVGGRGGGGGRRGGGGRGRGRGRGRGAPNTHALKVVAMQKHLIKLLQTLQSRKLEPLIVFSFSKRECEKYATAVANPDIGNLSFATAQESAAIEEVYHNMLQVLSREDRQLPALEHMLRILKRGVGVHHGGLLPILKELIEMLFQEGLIKVLFTTETFAMGLNMPARTVVFTSLKKFDGVEGRVISSGEYIQMSGRAGRRGKDDKGTVIVCADEELDLETCKGLMAGKPNPLLSSFRLSYYTLLNLLKRVEGGTDSLEYVIAHSFQQFQQESARPRLEAELRDLERQSSELQLEGQAAISEYKTLRQQLAEAEAVVADAMRQPDRALAFLRPGRLIRVKEGNVDWGLGIVVSVLRRTPKQQGSSAANGGAGAAAAADGTGDDALVANSAEMYIVDTLLPCQPGSVQAGAAKPAPVGRPPSSSTKGSGAAEGGGVKQEGGAANGSSSGADGAGKGGSTAELNVVPVLLPLVCQMSSLRVSLPTDLRPPEVRKNLLLVLEDIVGRYPQGLPLLDPVQDLGIREPEFLEAVATVSRLEQQLAKNPVFQAERDSERFALYAKKAALDERAEELRAQLKGTVLSQFKDESKARMQVLQKLGHTDKDGTVLLKGRAACEIDTTDELLSTELMFNGCFHGLDKHQLLALVSCLVECDKSNEQIKLVQQLAGPLQQLQDAALSIAAITRDAGLECDDSPYLETFNPNLMDVFFNWSLGKSFAEVASLTDIFEGSIIRVARRLDELMHQLAHAARVVGDEELATRFEESDATLRRGIMFSASLYL